MSTFELFKNAVRNSYREKKSLDELPDKLMRPSPANLRAYSLIRLAQGLSPEDLNVFESYFNPIRKYDDIELAIRKVDLNLLRSLQNFMIGHTEDPNDEIIKILAILINFQKRPYRRVDWEAKKRKQLGRLVIPQVSPQAINCMPRIDNSKKTIVNSKKHNKLFDAFAALPLTLILGLATYYLAKKIVCPELLKDRSKKAG